MSSQREERGAIAPLVAILLAALIPLTALVVDIGQLRVARQDMQSLADVVALDMSRLLGKEKRQILDATRATDVAKSVDRFMDDKNRSVRPLVAAEFGKMNSASGAFSTVGAEDIPSAVRITASTSVGFGFVPGASDTHGIAIATSADPNLCFSIGTKTLALNTAQSALSPLLDDLLRVNIEAVGYQGIVNLRNASVPLADVLVELKLGSVDEVLSTNVSLVKFIAATATVLGKEDPVQAQLLEAIEIGRDELELTVGDIVDLGTNSDLGSLSADINVFDLITAGVIAANGREAIGVSIPGVAELKITEPPKSACGRKGAFAQSAQVRLDVDTGLNPAYLPVGARLQTRLEVGAGKATLDGMECDPDEAVFSAETGVADLLFPEGTDSTLKLTVSKNEFLQGIPQPIKGLLWTLLLLVPELDIDVDIQGNVISRTDEVTFDYPPDGSVPAPISVPRGGGARLINFSALDVGLSASNAPWIVTGIIDIVGALVGGLTEGVLKPLVNGLLSPILSPPLQGILDTLGVRLGVADLNVHGPPECGRVRLAH